MRAKLHMYAMKFKPAIKKYRDAWRTDPDKYLELTIACENAESDYSGFGVLVQRHPTWVTWMRALRQTREMMIIDCVMF